MPFDDCSSNILVEKDMLDLGLVRPILKSD